MKRLRLGLLCAALLVGGSMAQDELGPEPPPAAAEDDGAAPAPVAVAVDGPLETLQAFWLALSAGYAEAFATTVAWPLTLQDLGEDGQPGGRYVVTAQSWPAFRGAFPAAPQPGPLIEVSEPRLDTVGAGLVVVTYTLTSPDAPGQPGGRQTAILSDEDGWKVVFATLPGAGVEEPPPGFDGWLGP